MNKCLKALCKKADLPDWVSAYTMRHSCATLLLNDRTNTKVVAQRLGHSGVETVLDVYYHPSDEQQIAASNHIETALLGGNHLRAVV